MPPGNGPRHTATAITLAYNNTLSSAAGLLLPPRTHPLTTPKVCCKCIAALSFSTTCRCCCSYCNPLQSLHALQSCPTPPYALRPTPYALRPTPYALRPTPYALRPMAALSMYCVTLRCTLLNLVIFH
jgi:hypothetical protein